MRVHLSSLNVQLTTLVTAEMAEGPVDEHDHKPRPEMPSELPPSAHCGWMQTSLHQRVPIGCPASVWLTDCVAGRRESSSGPV